MVVRSSPIVTSFTRSLLHLLHELVVGQRLGCLRRAVRNAWNTTISTTATITQSSRFLAKSFINSYLSPSWRGCSGAAPERLYIRDVAPYFITARLPCASAYTSGERLRDASGLRIDDLVIAPAQLLHVLVEPHALEQLDQEVPPVRRCWSAKSIASSARYIARGLVDRIHTAHIGGHVRQDKVHAAGRPGQATSRDRTSSSLKSP